MLKKSGLALSEPKGFTLVELLVVISIIAILSTIGLTVFANVNKSARDAKRKEDIQAIAKALEVNYNDSSGKYTALAANQFSGNTWPTDPQNGQLTGCNGDRCGYCGHITSNSTAVCTASNVINSTNPINGEGTTWSVCANLEKPIDGSNRFCATNSR